jgi:hypothetical protein
MDRATRKPAESLGAYDLCYSFRTTETFDAAGGHTIDLHVSQTDAQLAKRLGEDSGISAASTFTDELTAGRVVLFALQQNRTDITA